MRRDYFDVDVRTDDDASGESAPEVVVDFDGPAGTIPDRLDDGTNGPLDADELDVTVRLQTPLDDADAEGVLSVTNRLTGEFVLEANLSPDAVAALVDAARDRSDEDTDYCIRITDASGKSRVYEKRTLLVYDADGSLRRSASLIPGGVEL